MTANLQLATKDWYSFRGAYAANVIAESGELYIALADKKKSILAAQRLRYEVFHREFGGKKFPIGFDKDKYDLHAIHLLVMTKATHKVVGYYRLVSTNLMNHYYSNQEFDLAPIFERDGLKIELSRACIHKDYRNGATLGLLWKGIGYFAQQTKARYLIGIPSIKTSNPVVAAGVYQEFINNGYLDEGLCVKPRSDFEFLGFEDYIHNQGNESLKSYKQYVPPLMRTYFNAGAKVYGLPAFDRYFQCVDYPVVLDLNNVSKSFKRRYF